MTAPDRAAAVEIAADVLPYSAATTEGVSIAARQVVAALDAAGLLRRPDEAAYVAALEAVAEAAQEFREQVPWATAGVPLDRALAARDAVPAHDAGPTPAQEAAFTELVQLGQEIERETDQRTGDAPRERQTWGEWPPAAGDLVIRTLVATEPCPPGWNEWRDEQGQRSAWKVWTGPEPIGGNPDAVWAVRPPGAMSGDREDPTDA